MDRKKAQQEEAKNNPEQIKSEDNNKPEPNNDKPAPVEVVVEKEKEKEKEKEVIKNVENNEKPAADVNPEKEQPKKKPEYAPQRQAHCFIYYIKKLTE